MIVRMRYQMSGTRDGVEWPAPGGEIELPNDEAVLLLRNQMAEAVQYVQEPETTKAPKVEETREEAPKKPPAKRPGRPRKATAKPVER